MPPGLTPATFTDVDHFTEWEVGLGWEIESTQLSGGSNLIGFDHITFPGLFVGHFHGRRSMLNTFELPHGVVMFPISREPLPIIWNGTELPPGLTGIVQAGRTQWAVLPDGWDCYEFMVSTDWLARTEIFPPGFLEGLRSSGRETMPLLEPVTRRFVAGLDRMFAEVRSQNGLLVSAATRAEQYEYLLGGIRSVVDAALAAAGWEPARVTRRADLIGQAREYMAGHLAGSAGVDAIAEALGVSYRVLNYAFKDGLGLSPYQYLLTERLHASRRLLKSGAVSVLEACTTYGFSTPSRFARQYKRLFGVLPSADATNLRVPASETRGPHGR